MAVDYVRALKARAPKTPVSRERSTRSGSFKFLRKKGVTTADPFGDMELRTIRRKLPASLSVNEMNRLLSRIREPIAALLGVPSKDVFLTVRDRAMLETLYSAALRVSELCGANWDQIDWNNREITVTGKGNKTRVCPLGQKALEALLEYSRHYEHKWKARRTGAGVSLNVEDANQSADDSPDYPQMVQPGRRETSQPACFPTQQRTCWKTAPIFG